ncbi:unnamed protein product [Protopolystoma xenopodis]|uniref:Uncharacterized protein n=1 Tax=Protopolystoma xenopodis TaxID=117903 RepID=A0A448WD88_9PLAT|nr:unnamed protein product [Protopolystoma xenopodis]
MPNTPLIGGFTTGTSESSSQSTFPLLPRQSSLAKSAAPNLIHSTSLADVASGSASFLLLVDAVRDTTATSQLNSRRHSHVAVTSFGSDACYNSTISTVASSNQPIGKQTRLLLTGPSCQLPMSPLSSNDDCNMSSGRRFIQRTDRATSSWQLDGSPNARTNESDVDRLAEVQTGGTRRRPDKRCHVCSKRTGLANSYTCRCVFFLSNKIIH